ncbi:MAG TPA: AI-2E family transporter [Bacillota bacterium]|nr:AI-2E family transporter [Bacillota bacterium]
MNYRRILIAVLLLALLFIVIKYIFPLFAPFIIGLIIAGMIDPGVQWVESHWAWSRRYATLAVLVALIIAILVLILIIVGGVYREVDGLIKDLPKISKWGYLFVDRLNALFADFQRTIPKELLQGITKLTGNISSFVTQLSFGLINMVKALPDLIGNLIITTMSAYFFARDKEYWLRLLNRSLPTSWIPGLREVGIGLYNGMLRFVRLELSMMVITFFITGVFLTFLGFERAWLIGLMVGILEPIPMIGPGAVLLPWAGWSMVTGEWRIVICLLTLACLLMVARQWLELRLLGGKDGIHPFFTLIALYLGIKLFGIIGLIIAPLGLSILRPLTMLFSKKWNFQLERTL